MSEQRRNFSTKTINEVFEEQGRACKCGKPLIHGFHIHHIDGDNTNITKENCQLLCRGCHGGEQYKTLQEQKRRTLTQVTDLIDKAVKAEVAGALVDKTLDGIKLALSLQEQLYDDKPFEAPAELRMEYSIVIEQAKMNSYSEGYLAGLQRNLEIIEQVKRNKK